jgi:hypothetical protein
MGKTRLPDHGNPRMSDLTHQGAEEYVRRHATRRDLGERARAVKNQQYHLE